MGTQLINNQATRVDERKRELVKIRRRGFWIHVLIYVVLNTIQVLGWAASGEGFFWPIFVMVAWGAGLLYNAYFAYVLEPKVSPGTLSSPS